MLQLRIDMFISLWTSPALDPSFHVHVPSLDITRCNIWNLTLEELAAETKQRDVVQQAWTLHAIEYNCGLGGFCAVMCRRCSMSGCLPLACLSWAYMSNMTGTSAFHFTMRCAEPWQDLRASKTAQTLMINRLDDIERRRRTVFLEYPSVFFCLKQGFFQACTKGLLRGVALLAACICEKCWVIVLHIFAVKEQSAQKLRRQCNQSMMQWCRDWDHGAAVKRTSSFPSCWMGCHGSRAA